MKIDYLPLRVLYGQLLTQNLQKLDPKMKQNLEILQCQMTDKNRLKNGNINLM